MGNELGISRKSAGIRAAVYGVVSLALFGAVFGNSALVMTYFTKGGIHALLPVATVFIFSFVHGSFASNVWTALGINASIQTEKRPEERARIEKTTRPDTRPVINA